MQTAAPLIERRGRMDPGSGTGQRSTHADRRGAAPVSDPAPTLGSTRDGDEWAAELALSRDLALLVNARLRLDGLLLQVSTNPTVPAGCGDIGCYVPGPGAPALAADQPTPTAPTVRAR